MSTGIDGRVIAITGGGSGMGRALAFVLARLGARVVICGRSEEKLQSVATAVEQHCGRAEIGRAHV